MSSHRGRTQRGKPAGRPQAVHADDPAERGPGRDARRLLAALAQEGAAPARTDLRAGFLVVAAPRNGITAIIANAPAAAGDELVSNALARWSAHTPPRLEISEEGASLARRRYDRPSPCVTRGPSSACCSSRPSCTCSATAPGGSPAAGPTPPDQPPGPSPRAARPPPDPDHVRSSGADRHGPRRPDRHGRLDQGGDLGSVRRPRSDRSSSRSRRGPTAAGRRTGTRSGRRPRCPPGRGTP